jgi:hypothetical protein
VNRRPDFTPLYVAHSAGTVALLSLLLCTEPFVLKEGETGKENGTPNFPTRSRRVLSARQGQDPGLTRIADLSFPRFLGVESFDMQDNHLYNSPHWFIKNAHHYDG